MKTIEILFSVILSALIICAILFCIDREAARKQYNAGELATECIFQANCDHYNAKRLEEF